MCGLIEEHLTDDRWDKNAQVPLQLSRDHRIGPRGEQGIVAVVIDQVLRAV